MVESRGKTMTGGQWRCLLHPSYLGGRWKNNKTDNENGNTRLEFPSTENLVKFKESHQPLNLQCQVQCYRTATYIQFPHPMVLAGNIQSEVSDCTVLHNFLTNCCCKQQQKLKRIVLLVNRCSERDAFAWETLIRWFSVVVLVVQFGSPFAVF